MFEKLIDRIPPFFYYFLGMGFITLSFSTGWAIIKSSNVTFNHGETKINIGKVKQLTNDTEYANKVLQQKLDNLDAEMKALKLVITEDYEAGAALDSVNSSIEEIKPVVNEINRSTEQLKEVVKKEAIAQ